VRDGQDLALIVDGFDPQEVALTVKLVAVVRADRAAREYEGRALVEFEVDSVGIGDD
jgi:hypothetical protein